MRFDYIKYDEKSVELEKSTTEQCVKLEKFILENISAPRYRMLAITRLEEVAMWIKKGIRDDQTTLRAKG